MNDHRYVGIYNQGVTCYMNSLLQALFMCKPFRIQILKYRGQSVTCQELSRLFANLLLTKDNAVHSTRLTSTFGWNKLQLHTQQDVHEFLIWLFSRLLRSDGKNVSFIREIFMGIVGDYFKCDNCKECYTIKDGWFDLQLNVYNISSVTKAIEQYLIEERMIGDNQYYCHGCRKNCDATKGISLLQLPDVLNIYLKRYDDYGNKLKHFVEFEETLDMNNYLSQPNPHNVYNLYAIIVHTGSSMSGHYYSYIKLNDQWYEFNDSRVTLLEDEEWKQAFGGKGSSGTAYMLMYKSQKPSEKFKELDDMSTSEELSLINRSFLKDMVHIDSSLITEPSTTRNKVPILESFKSLFKITS
jgi:ubiquitin carboxyl-terminal hydrolase 7